MKIAFEVCRDILALVGIVFGSWWALNGARDATLWFMHQSHQTEWHGKKIEKLEDKAEKLDQRLWKLELKQF